MLRVALIISLFSFLCRLGAPRDAPLPGPQPPLFARRLTAAQVAYVPPTNVSERSVSEGRIESILLYQSMQYSSSLKN
jgi:hypothetical protein